MANSFLSFSMENDENVNKIRTNLLIYVDEELKQKTTIKFKMDSMLEIDRKRSSSEFYINENNFYLSSPNSLFDVVDKKRRNSKFLTPTINKKPEESKNGEGGITLRQHMKSDLVIINYDDLIGQLQNNLENIQKLGRAPVMTRKKISFNTVNLRENRNKKKEQKSCQSHCYLKSLARNLKSDEKRVEPQNHSGYSRNHQIKLIAEDSLNSQNSSFRIFQKSNLKNFHSNKNVYNLKQSHQLISTELNDSFLSNLQNSLKHSKANDSFTTSNFSSNNTKTSAHIEVNKTSNLSVNKLSLDFVPKNNAFHRKDKKEFAISLKKMC